MKSITRLSEIERYLKNPKFRQFFAEEDKEKQGILLALEDVRNILYELNDTGVSVDKIIELLKQSEKFK